MNQQHLERWFPIGMGLVVFLFDWSGYDRSDPGLFFPKPIREIWWHLPVEIAFVVVMFQLLKLLDRRF
jgi:hypothetical protein